MILGTSDRIINTVLVLCVICSSVNIVSPIDPHRRAKRIAFGEPVPSMDTYRTYYFVQLRRSWACVTDQTNHENSMKLCQADYQKCGGTLIHPEFVLTAAHCVMYYEVNLRIKGESIDDWIKDKYDQLWYALIEAWEKFEHWVVGLFILPKPRHTVYSDWALLMGSNDYFKMTQKRQVTKVFPHRKFPKNLRSDFSKIRFRATLNSWHDVALLRACEAFKIKSGEVEVAPMLRTVQLLKEQYERIVRQGTTCLYIGFGKQDSNRTEAKLAGHPYYQQNLLLHTWRSSKCNSECNNYQLKSRSEPHTCFLCSWHHGYTLGVAQPGDSGGPVTCEHNFVATITKGSLDAPNNWTRTGAYPLHCIKHSITEDRLNYYKTVNYSRYHPLLGTRLRRLPLTPE